MRMSRRLKRSVQASACAAALLAGCSLALSADIGGDAELRTEAVRRSLEVKAEIVAADEHETGGERALLNFGHTFAHAYEALADYDGSLLHGEAVSVGMIKAMTLSARLGHCDRAEVELVRETSLDALPQVPPADVVIVDGDHNYHVVSEELRLIAERAPGAELPLLLFHDVAWPHGRRDDYFDPEQIPEGRRHPVAGSSGGIFPGEPAITRLIGAVLLEQNDEWQTGHRYMQLEGMAEFAAPAADPELAQIPPKAA